MNKQPTTVFVQVDCKDELPFIDNSNPKHYVFVNNTMHQSVNIWTEFIDKFPPIITNYINDWHWLKPLPASIVLSVEEYEKLKPCSNLVEEINSIIEDEGHSCNRCEGNGKLWADGKAHYPSYEGNTVNCGVCGGEGKIFPDIKETLQQALDNYNNQIH